MQVLRGSSNVCKDTVYNMLGENKKEQEAVEAEIRNCKTAVSKENFRLRFLDNKLKDIVDWGEQFVSMTTDEQRAVLNQLINRIEVSRDYEIKILFNVNLDDFFGEESEEKTGKIPS